MILRRLQITGCLGLSKWVDTGMAVFLYECKDDRKSCTYGDVEVYPHVNEDNWGF